MLLLCECGQYEVKILLRFSLSTNPLWNSERDSNFLIQTVYEVYFDSAASVFFIHFSFLNQFNNSPCVV